MTLRNAQGHGELNRTMKKIRVGINGFGRIGRIAARIILSRSNVELVAINSRTAASSHAYLLKYDSTYGTFSPEVKAGNNFIAVNKQKIDVFNHDLPDKIPWNKVNADIIVESTGKFRDSVSMQGHLRNGSKYVVLSAPAKDDTKTIILGLNQNEFDKDNHKIVSNSSCTTNCLAVTLKVLDDNLSVSRGFMTTTHAVTDSQNLLDNSHKREVRLRRAAFASLIPTSTGSAKDIGKIFPNLRGKIICQSVRAPIFTVSLLNLIVETKKKTSIEEVNKLFQKEEEGMLKGILAVAEDELVSKDFTGTPYSSIVDPYLTQVVGENLVNVSAWYDNEWGYTTRLVDLVEYIGKTL